MNTLASDIMKLLVQGNTEQAKALLATASTIDCGDILGDDILDILLPLDNPNMTRLVITSLPFDQQTLWAGLYECVINEYNNNVDVLFEHVEEDTVLDVLRHDNVRGMMGNYIHRLQVLQQSREDKRALTAACDVETVADTQPRGMKL